MSKMPPSQERRIADENIQMKRIADRIAANAGPSETSRLEVAYAIARHLKLDWPAAYEEAKSHD